MNEILQGDCMEVMKKLEPESVDLICTDPPYGYSFMGKNWDKAVPSVDVWKECLRILKPGGFAFVMSAPRQDVLSQMIMRIAEAGFQTNFTSIYWTYASGFPKAANIGKMVDKRAGAEREVIGVSNTCTGPSHTDATTPNYNARKYSGGGTIDGKIAVTAPATRQAKALDGSYGGFQPKPAVEVIIVAMKPLSEKTYIDQAVKNGKGITWMDDGRIPLNGETTQPFTYKESPNNVYGKFAPRERIREQNPQGRFPANLLVSDDILNDGQNHIGWTGQNHNTRFNPYGGNSLNKSTTEREGYKKGFDKNGTYSRYFDLDSWARTFPFLIVPKASKKEKNEGVESVSDYTERDNGFSTKISGTNKSRANNHPTVKPVKLMSYLITLGSRPGDTVLDPFSGTCTTGIAAKNLGRKYICIEKEGEYVKICNQRLSAAPNSLFV